jgi:integrase
MLIFLLTYAICLIFKSPKSKKSKRTIPLPLDVAVALRLHRIYQRKEKQFLGSNFQDQNLVFSTSKGTPIGPRNFTRKFEALRKRAGLSPDINLHGLRHTYATRLLERGESLKTVQELLGHEDISTTGNTYAHVMPEIKKQAAQNLNSLLKRKKASLTRD